jgi:hypothetical protein
MYMLGVQAGIQAQHSGQHLCNKYAFMTEGAQNENAIEQYKTWATEHETSIVVNAGYQSNMQRLLHILNNPVDDKHVAWAAFYEEKCSLNGALTSIAVVLEERLYQIAKHHGNDIEKHITLSDKGELIGTSTVNMWRSEEYKDVELPLPTRDINSPLEQDMYMHYHHETKSISFERHSTHGSKKSGILATLSSYEVSIIIFMHRLRLCT